VVALDHVPRHVRVVLLGEEVQLGVAQPAVAAVVDLEHALDRLGGLVPRLLLLAWLLLAVPLLVRWPVLLGLLLRLGLRRAIEVQRRAFRRWLPFRTRSRSGSWSGSRGRGLCAVERRIFRAPLIRGKVVLDVHDPALGIQRRRLARVLTAPLAAPAAAPPAIAPEAAPTTAAAPRLTLLSLPELLAVPVDPRLLGVAGVARLRRVRRRRLRGFRWCGGTLSFSIHRLRSIPTSSAGG